MEGNFGGGEMLANDHKFTKFSPTKFYASNSYNTILKWSVPGLMKDYRA